MNCCIECFVSSYLKAVIRSFNKQGKCDFCNSENVLLIEPKELARFFRNLLEQYTIDSSGRRIETQIEVDFPGQIFSNGDFPKVKLLAEILSEDLISYQPLLSNNVSLKLGKHHLDAHKLWDTFKNEIKNTNRFHIKNALDLEKLKTIFLKEDALTKTIKVDTLFYRSRISDKEGLPPSKMGNPPVGNATAGRANPKGISYLYLSDQAETTLYEIRSTLFDYITVGVFLVKEELKVLNLRNFVFDPMSWTENEEIDIFLIYSPFIDKFQEDLSKPIRRSDSEIDYLPTQYLSEFIKSIGYDGVEFQSSLYQKGYNLAIFKPEKFECIGAEVYEIEKLKLTSKML